METVLFTKPDGTTETFEPGCIFDGAFGWHNGARVYRLARDLGYLPNGLEDADEIVARYDTGDDDDTENALWLINEAEDFLNNGIQEDWYFTFDDGYYLWSYADMCQPM